MLRYFMYCMKKKVSPKQARFFFNTSMVSKKKKLGILKKSGIELTDQATITDHFYFEFGNISLIGNVFINANCCFLDNAKITIQDKTMIGPNVTLSTATHRCEPEIRHGDKNIIHAPINIGENVWVGANSVILPGVTIGKNSVIAANSVVTSDIPENSLYAGSPAVFKKNI